MSSPEDRHPEMNLTFSTGQEIVATPENAFLFTFVGELAVHNCVFLKTRTKEDGTAVGIFFHEFSDRKDTYNQMRAQMMQHRYPGGYTVHDNLRETTPSLEEAYQDMLKKQQAEDTFIPDGWDD